MQVGLLRRSPHARWKRLELAPGLNWLDLASLDAPDGVRILYAMLDARLLEAWQDHAGRVRLRSPVNGHHPMGK